MSENEWILQDDIAYLNHAAVSPWPKRTREAVCQFANENATRGSQNYLRWLDKEQLLRTQLASLIHAASTDEIALVKNTSEGLSFIAAGLNWQAGDNVVISDEEFPSNRIVWESLRDQGVEVRQVALGSQPEAALCAAMDSRTRLLSISSVQYASGLRVDLENLGAYCKQQNVLFCIDAIQSIGALQFDVQRYQADFVVADGHKWMLGPEGLGLFYCRRELLPTLQLYEFGWHMVEQIGDFDRKQWLPAASARRFECGSPNMLTIHAMSASLSLLLELGMVEVEKRLLNNVDYLAEQLKKIPQVSLASSENRERRSGIITFNLSDGAEERVYQQLMQHGVMCALRSGRLRFSPHYYTRRESMDNALGLLGQFIG